MRLATRPVDPYLGMIVEATGFASQSVLRKFALPDFGFIVEKPYKDFKDPESGEEMFPTVQTSTVVLQHQSVQPVGSPERVFQEATFFAGAHGYLINRMGVGQQLRLYALHSVASGSKAVKHVSRLKFVERAKMDAKANLLEEKLSLEVVRAQFVKLISDNFPDWQAKINSIESVPISRIKAENVARVMAAEEERSKGSVDSTTTDAEPMGGRRDRTHTTADIKAMWVPKKFAPVCQRCKVTKFSVLNWRHHCRRCGLVICGDCGCTKEQLPANFDVGGVHRVCRICAETGFKEGWVAVESVSEDGGDARTVSKDTI